VENIKIRHEERKDWQEVELLTRNKNNKIRGYIRIPNDYCFRKEDNV